nr:prophenoloxidase inhibitor N terminus [Locusta migratoria, hemolymph, Peptide Partial, 15 aa] [Locusta migratoria]
EEKCTPGQVKQQDCN